MNDFLDAVKSRLKAPYFGYAILALLTFNWKALFLFISIDGDPFVRLAVFEANTNFLRLYVAPIATGFIVTAATPWLQWFFSWFTHSPSEKKTFLALNAESRQLAEKARLEYVRTQILEERNMQQAAASRHLQGQEQELIDRAKRDEYIQNIENIELKKTLQAEINELRRKQDKALMEYSRFPYLSEEERFIFLRAKEFNDGKIFIQKGSSNYILDLGGYSRAEGIPFEESRYAAAITSLLTRGFIKQVDQDGTHFVLSEKGWKAASDT